MDNVWKICGIKLCLLFLWIGYRSLSQFIERKKDEEDRREMKKEIKKSSQNMLKLIHLHKTERKVCEAVNKIKF